MKIIRKNVRFQVLTEVKITMLFWVVKPCGLMGRYLDYNRWGGLGVPGEKRQKNSVARWFCYTAN
jgi:hypothetical protein